MNITLLFLAALPLAQEPEPAQESHSPKVTALRERIHGLRMNLLLGGDEVRRAENEAIDFYASKANLIEDRLDTIEADLSEKEAGYELALDAALEARQSEARAKEMKRALNLRGELEALQSESDELGARRASLSKLIAAVEARGRERERLATQIETSDDLNHTLGLPISGIGLAPEIDLQAPASPFDDPEFVADLWHRNPRDAAWILFDADPERYLRWRAPIGPPAETLQRVLPLPLPDPPGRR